VISIPDWGVTPFAAGRDIETIATEITRFNQVCRYEAALAEVHFIDITESQREDGKKADFLAPDGLHPSEREYKKWSELISDSIIETLED
jgi:lysophospholipase L1-like esterase